MRRLVLMTLLAGVTSGLAAQDSALVERARGIHQRVLALDTHDDIDPANFTREKNYTQRLSNQVNLPKMFEGGLDAAFFIVFVGQSSDFTPAGYAKAYAAAMEKFKAVHRLTEELAPDKIGLALTAADVPRIYASGRKVALIGVENAYPIGEDLGNIQKFYDQGGRYMSLAHNGHNQFSDSNTGERDGIWKYHGLSDLGKKAIAELNRLGIMVDVSHPSKESMLQTIALTKAPVIASHSGVRALANNSRNLDDEQLLALGKNGGVAQMVAFSGFVKVPAEESPERKEAVAALRKEMGLSAEGRGMQGLSEDKRTELQRRMAELDKRVPPPPRATVKDFVNHIDYAVKLIGIDHVGISSDFDGGGGLEGWSDASETFNVTLELVRRGYTEEQIGKLWSGNLLRVMAECERVAGELKAKA